MTFPFKSKDDPKSLPKQISAYLSQYVQNRLDDFDQIKSSKFDLLFIRDYCHKVIGSARSYNLFQLEEITIELQELARREEKEQIKTLLEDYGQYLNELAKKHLA